MSVLTVRKGAFVPGTTQNILTGGASVQSNPVGDKTSIVRISCQQDTFVEISDNPTATVNSMMISGGGTEFLSVVPGVTIVAVMQVTASGIASITELTGY